MFKWMYHIFDSNVLFHFVPTVLPNHFPVVFLRGLLLDHVVCKKKKRINLSSGFFLLKYS